MRLHLLLSTVETAIAAPVAWRWCQSPQVGHWQSVKKPLRDTRLEQVIAERYQCRACGRTFRVYPLGVTRGHAPALEWPGGAGVPVGPEL